VLLDMAKQDAKDRNQYFEDAPPDRILAGGVSKTTVIDGSVTTEAKNIAQIKTEGKSIDFTSALGSQHSREVAIRAEAGIERSKTTDLGGGNSITEIGKAYAEISGEAKAEVIKTKAKTSVEVVAKLAAHAEVSHTETVKVGNVEATKTVRAAAHAEATAKAGASLGFDGVQVKASASVEASVKANMTHEVKIGDVKIKDDLEVYAKAKAEAKAEAKVNFNPFGKEGVGAKVGIGAEAAAGVGIQKTTGFKTAGGGGAEVGGGLYAGKIGAKADVDVGFKDGKLSANIDVGAALGVGVSVKLKLDTNIKKSFNDAKQDIINGNVFEKIRGVATIIPIGTFVRGFFS
jgi:hypothetical protein